jgi:hypothetical protein
MIDVPEYDDFFKATYTPSSMKAIAPKVRNMMTLPSVIVIPQALAVPIMASPSKDALNIGVAVAA